MQIGKKRVIGKDGFVLVLRISGKFPNGIGKAFADFLF